jgi:hypothetical protein
MAIKNKCSVWELLDVMKEFYESTDLEYDTYLRSEIDNMLVRSSIRQFYNELAEYYRIPVPAGNMDTAYAEANLWQMAYNMMFNGNVIEYYRIYVPFDGEPGVREYIEHCEATHMWFRNPVDESSPKRQSFHKK